MKKTTLISTLSVLALLLAACGQNAQPQPTNPNTNPPTPTPTPTLQPASPTETRSALNDVVTTANSLAGDFQREVQQLLSDLGVSAAPMSVTNWIGLTSAGVPSHDVLISGQFKGEQVRLLGEAVAQVEAVGLLPRGIYTNNARGTNLVKTGESDDYIETRQTPQGVLRFYADWDASSVGPASRTAILHSVFNGQAETRYQPEIPTKAVFTITLGETTLASASISMTHKPSTCISERYLNEPPLAAQAEGFVARLNGQKAVEANAGYTINGTSITSKGEVKATATNQASVKWDVSATLSLQSGACGQTVMNGFGPNDNVNFSSELKVNEKTLGLKFKADQFPEPGNRNPALRLQDGLFTVDTKKVEFAGTLDDANQNCIPGDNITLTFSSGTTSLEAFLVSQYNLPVCRR